MISTEFKCPCCKNLNKFKKFIPKYKYSIYHNNLKYYIYNFICSECGYVFQKQQYNKNFYFQLNYITQKDYKTHAKNRAKYIFDFITSENILIKNQKEFNILDIGSGAGGVGYYLKKLFLKINPNTQITGITAHEEKNVFIDTIYADIDDIENVKKLINKKYNLIIMCHSLEHLFNPDIVIKYIYENLLKNESYLYIEVPSLYTVKARYPVTFIPQHISYFTITSLNNLILNNSNLINIKIKESKYWGNIKALYIKLTTINNNKKFIKENFVELKYLIYQIKNKFIKFYMLLFKNKIKPND